MSSHNKKKERLEKLPLQKTIVVAMGVLSFFVIMEIALRAGGFAFSWLQEYRNTRALREKGSVYRIMCLGDSTTALGGKDSYPLQLERILDEKKGRAAFSVVNKGAILVDTTHILEHLEENIAKYDPDLVTLMAGTNDRYAPYLGAIPWNSRFPFAKLRTCKFLMLVARNLLDKTRQASLPASGQADAGDAPIEYQLKQRLDGNPGEGSLYHELGRFYQDRGRYAEAKNIFKKALDLDPRDANAYFAMGVICMDEAQYGQAEDMFRRVIQLSPRSFMAYMEMAFVYKAQKKFGAAESIIKEGMARDQGKNTWAYSELGFIYKAQGKYVEAEKMLNISTELLPQYFWAYAELVDCYKIQGRYQEAAKVLTRAIQANPEDDKAVAEMGRLYQAMGKREYAAEYLDKASRLRSSRYAALTGYNFRAIKRILDRKRIRLVCVQYPMRSVKPLRDIYRDEPGVIFVDNENTFKEAVRKSRFDRYFVDMFAGDFGHCSPEGNRLLAENIADAIWRELRILR